MIYQKDCFPVLEKTHGVREVSHFLAYFDEFTTSLDGFKNSSAEFFWKHPVFWFCFLIALNKFTLSKSKGELCLSYLLRVFLRAPIYISIYKMTTQALEEETWARFRARYGDTREDVSGVISPSLPCTTCLQTISCFFGWQFSRPTRTLIPSGTS